MLSLIKGTHILRKLLNFGDIPKELLTPSPEFLTASESLGLHWWHWEQDNGKLTLGPGLLEILGLDPATFDHSLESIYKNIHPDDVKSNQERLKKTLYGEEKLYEVEYRVKDKNGEWQWFYNRGMILQHNSEGRPQVFGGITIDISGQFKHLMAMVEEKEKLEFIFRNTHEAILLFEMKDGYASKVLEANKAAMELFKQSDTDLEKQIPKCFIDDEVLGAKGKLFSQLEEKGFAKVEKKMEKGDGKYMWLEVTAHSFTQTGLNLVMAIASDKTSTKRTEEALRESERLYRTLVEAADDCIGLFSVDHEIVLMNSALHEAIGYTKEEYEALNLMELIHPDDVMHVGIMEGVLQREGAMSVDFRAKHKEGHYVHLSSKNVLLPAEKGEDTLILSIMRDDTERKQTIKELQEAKDRAEESDQLKSAFLANMSHEIRTPMNSIIGFSNLLVNPTLEVESRELYVNRIIRNSELLLALITDIIDLAKIESGQLSIIYGKLLFGDLIGDMEQYAKDEVKRLGKEHILIRTVVGRPDCTLETDVIRIAQVMKNLINNAIKFTKSGSVEIGCKEGTGEDTLIFYVKDTGIGIAPEHFDLIFDQFRQIDGSNTRKFGGTGLGLAICKNLIRLMGGRIWVESKVGEGAVFQIELPVKSSNVVLSRDPGQRFQATSNGVTKDLSIMVVDDEEDSLELYRALLSTLGYSVNTAMNGFDALKILERKSMPDLVLMDVSMPVLSGTDTLRIMKERYPEIKVVAQSAHALVGDRDRFLNDGYDEYLPKPFSEEQLSGIIAKLFKD
ncbi:MAG: PAS domain S-box protein [Bacteroidota bacterium]